jgi:hypothetical protein
LPDELTGRFTGEGQGRFNFGVLWKVFGIGQVKSTARRLEPVSALLSSLQSIRYAMNIS